MPQSVTKVYQFSQIKKQKILASFNGGSVTSDAGGLFLREADRKINLLKPIAKLFPDKRDKSKVQHSVLGMLRQRVFAVAMGYEDLNDQKTLRKDLAMQTIVGSEKDLASSPTLSRFENSANSSIAWTIHKKMIESFISSYESTPKELILDFDATDDLIHGNQEGRFYHGYYGNYCFLPLYVFCGKQMLVSYLRRSNRDGARHAWAILSLLVKELKKKWPNVKIIFRGDSGYCRHAMLTWCENHSVFYITGLARNKLTEKILAPYMEQAKKTFEETKIKQRVFTEFSYAAKSWANEKKIIGKAEYGEQGANPRFIVTNLDGDPEHLYEKVYCARGDMENRIKEVQLGLFADRTSCHEWWANQLRMLLSALAYILVEYIRRTALLGTCLENAQVNTIRLRLFKVGATVVKTKQRIRFLLSSHFPLQDLFEKVCRALIPT